MDSLGGGTSEKLDHLYLEDIKYYSLREDQKIIFVHVDSGEFCVSFVGVLFVCGLLSPLWCILRALLLPKEYRSNDMGT